MKFFSFFFFLFFFPPPQVKAFSWDWGRNDIINRRHARLSGCMTGSGVPPYYWWPRPPDACAAGFLGGWRPAVAQSSPDMTSDIPERKRKKHEDDTKCHIRPNDAHVNTRVVEKSPALYARDLKAETSGGMKQSSQAH